MISALFMALAALTIICKSTSAQYVLTAFAGTGSEGNTGDGGPATSAQLRFAVSIWVDTLGEAFFVDYSANVVRSVSTTGIITRIGGTGSGVVATSGGAFTSVPLYNPWGLVGDTAGTTLYVSDQYRIWKYNRADGIVSILAGTGTQGLAGNGGPVSSAQTNQVDGMWLTTTNILYIAEMGNHLVRTIDLGSGIISTFAGGGGIGFGGDGGPAASTNTKLNGPQRVYINENAEVFVTDRNNGRVRMISTGGIISTYAGGGPSSNSGDGFDATNTYFSFIYDVKSDTIGNIFIIDDANRIRVVDYATKIVSTYISSDLILPRTIWLDLAADRALIGMIGFVKSTSLYVNPVPGPSATPTEVPTAMPSIVPTAIPSETPTANPTEIPTERPSVPPTFIPSATPTEIPTESPSVIPSFIPSATPTVTPTERPSELPSSQPSSAPTNPTFRPTRSPSSSPTSDSFEIVKVSGTSRVKFVNGLTLNELSLSTLLDTFKNISGRAESTEITSTVLVGQVTTLSLSTVRARTDSDSRSGSGSVGALAVGPVTAIYDIGFVNSYWMTSYPSKTSSEVAVMKAATIRQAIEEGLFDEILRGLARARNATQLLNGTSKEVLSLSTTITKPVDTSSESDSDDQVLSEGEVAGLVIGVLLGCVLLGLLLYVVLKRQEQEKERGTASGMMLVPSDPKSANTI